MNRLSLGLELLHERLLEMSALVEGSIGRSVASLHGRDEGLARQVLSDEKLINTLEIGIDELALRLLALHQPVACDLRYITAALKINTDLERIGDLATTVARRSMSLLRKPQVTAFFDIPRMAELSQGMLAMSLQAFIDKDADMASTVLISDDAVDDLRDSVTRDLVALMQREPGTVEQGIDLIFIVRSLERIADHATNIAEDVLFLIRGVDVRHGAQPAIQKVA